MTGVASAVRRSKRSKIGMMVQEWNKLSGSVLGNGYVLGEVISAHQRSATFNASLPGDDNPVIAEVMRGDVAALSSQRNSWSLACGLIHPRLLRIYDTGEESLNGETYIYAVKEAAQECLANILRTRALTVEEARQVVESVLLSLDDLHAKSLVHGAVRPESIMAVDGQIKLTAETISFAKRSASSMADDMYGLGTTILDVLTPDADLRALPSPLREIAAGCLQPDEARRWTAARALKVLSGTGAPRRSPLVGASVAIGTVICALALIFVSQRPAQSSKRANDPINDDRPSPIPERVTAERPSITNTQSGAEPAVPAVAPKAG
ncbi:MAG: hypothetical protein M3Z32_00585, partial [Acidobacteriota bacterium]|nr:hypothetical protein [Acidobacteriota bacterium]